MSGSVTWIDEKTMIPDLLRNAPQARAVLDRYGLRGCGGPLGPVEPLGFFAKAHDIDLARLLQEIRDACSGTGELSSAVVNPADKLSDTIYRPFFKAGIAVVLTLGAVWGAYLLLRIGFLGSFGAAGLHEVNAHGHAQIFGWVGLFVMGFAYQAFPRFKQTTLCHPRLAWSSLWLMVIGLIGRSVSEPLANSFAEMGIAAVSASVLEVIAISIFVVVIVRTLHTSQKPWVAYDYYIFCSLAWFVIQAFYETVYLAATLSANDREQLVHLVRTYQGALRDIQIHGFALLMILGVSQRIFPHFYGFPAPSMRISKAALLGVNAAVIGEGTGLTLMGPRGQAWAALWYASVLLLTAAVGMLVYNWKIFRSSEESDRSLKFLRTAYGWLLISLGMLVLVPVYQFGLLPRFAPESTATQIRFSHAYYGAIRHAITVGFISLMIVGVAAKVVPTLNGVDVHALSALWLPFLLINTGCALRVVAQTLTDFTDRAFPVAGVSGILEVLGLALWGGHLWLIMAGRARIHNSEPRGIASYTTLSSNEPIAPTNRVEEVLERYPNLLDTFVALGFKPLANPLLRKTLARHVTIERACRIVGADTQQFVGALNARRGLPATGRLTLPLLSDDGTLLGASGAHTQPVTSSED